jgi:predicted transcriptional regulator
MENTIMTEKIARRGVKTPHSYEPDILERLTVDQVINGFEIVFNEEDSIQKVREWLSEEKNNQSNYFVVSNIDGKYKGILSSSILFSNQNFQENKIGTLLKSNNASAKLNDTLRIVAEIMAKENIDVLPVVEENNIVGIVSYRDILASYKHRTDNHEMKKPHISFKTGRSKIIITRKEKTFNIRYQVIIR